MKTQRFNAELALLLASVLVAFLTATFTVPANTVERANMVGAWAQDDDRDGIPNLFDICPGQANVGAPDRDNDGITDKCDIIPNGDGVVQVSLYGNIYLAGAPGDQ